MYEFEDFNWKYLESRKIYRIAYDNNNLYVEYVKRVSSKPILFDKNKGKSLIYIYKGVPERIFNDILNKTCLSESENIPSHGATLYQLVEKSGQYKPEKEYW